METTFFFPMTEIKIIPFKESDIIVPSRPLHNYIRKSIFSNLGVEFIFQRCTRFGLEITIQKAPYSDSSNIYSLLC